MIKSFRGLMQDNTQLTIRLGTNNGLTGYRITKFAIIPHDPTNNTSSMTMKIYKTPQTTSTRDIDFSDSALIGVALQSHNTTLQNYPEDLQVIFDNEIFNQDIYLTLNNAAGNDSCNYYLELEQIKLAQDEAAVATLKDMRGSN